MTLVVTGPDTVFGFAAAGVAASSGLSVKALASPLHSVEIEGVNVVPSSSSLLDLESCMTALAGATSVIHCTGGRTFARPDDGSAARADVEGTRNLLVAMSRMGVERLYFVASALLLEPGTPEEPADESARARPPSLACLESLRASVDLVQRYGDDGSIKPVFLYPTLLFSTGAAPRGEAGWFLDHPDETSALDGVVNIASAAEAGRAAVKALGRAVPGETYILGGTNIECATLGGLIPRKPGKKIRGERAGIFRRGSRQVPPMTARLAPLGLYYSSSRAQIKLDLRTKAPEELVQNSH